MKIITMVYFKDEDCYCCSGIGKGLHLTIVSKVVILIKVKVYEEGEILKFDQV